MLFGTQAWSEEPFSFAVLGQGSGGNVVEGEATLSAAFSTSASTVEQTAHSHARDILNRSQGNGYGSDTYPRKGLTWGQGTDVYISNTDSTGIDIEFVQGTVDQDNEFQPYNTNASYVRLTNNTGGDIDFSSGGILAKWRYISKSGTTYTSSDFGGTSLSVNVIMGAEASPNQNLGKSYWGYGEGAHRFDGVERDYAGTVQDFTWADGEEIRLMFQYEISGIDSTSSITVSNYSTDIQIDINELVLDYNNRGTSNINYQNSWDVSTDGIRIVIPDRTEFVPGTKDIIGGLLIDDPAASMDAQIDQTTTAIVGSGSSVEASSQFDMTVTPVMERGGVATMDLQFDQTTQSTNLSLNIATLSAQFDQTITPTYVSTGNTSTMSSVFETTKTTVTVLTDGVDVADLYTGGSRRHGWTGQTGSLDGAGSGITINVTNPNDPGASSSSESTMVEMVELTNDTGSTISIGDAADSATTEWTVNFTISNRTAGSYIECNVWNPNSLNQMLTSSLTSNATDGTFTVTNNVSNGYEWADGETLELGVSFFKFSGSPDYDIKINYIECMYDNADTYSSGTTTVTDGFRINFADPEESPVVGGDITALKIANFVSTASVQFDQTTTPNKVHGAQATMDANVTHTTDAVKTVSADATMDANFTHTSTPNVVRGFSGYIIGNSEHTDGGTDRLRTGVSSMESIYEQAADAIRKAGGVASMDALFEKTVDDQVILSLVSTMDMNFPQTSAAIRLAGGVASMDANFTDTTIGNRLLQIFNLDMNSQFDQTSVAIKRMFGTTTFNMLFDADFEGDFLWGKSLQNIGTDGSWVNIDADTLTQTQLVTSAVTVATGTNQYGTGNKYYIQGYTGASPTVTIEEGKTFRFTQDDPSNATHPLRFSTTPNGTWGGGGEYTTGVTVVGTAGQAGSYTQITVAKDTPTLYYYCVNHSGMGGQINTPGSLWVDLSTGEIISGNWEDRVV